jgi:hypothetical protein
MLLLFKGVLLGISILSGLELEPGVTEILVDKGDHPAPTVKYSLSFSTCQWFNP